MLGDSETISIKLVATEGAIDDWALYVAPGDWTDEKAREEGSKLPEDLAAPLAIYLSQVSLFKRDWARLTYRH